MGGRYFEDFRIGEEFVTPGRTVTEADIVNFAGVSGDFYSLHTDASFAASSMFKQRVAHGAFTFAAMTGLWLRLGITEGTLVAFLGCDHLRFTTPVFIGDTIHARLRVAELTPQEQHGRVRMATEVQKQRGEVVMTADAILVFKRRGSPAGSKT